MCRGTAYLVVAIVACMLAGSGVRGKSSGLISNGRSCSQLLDCAVSVAEAPCQIPECSGGKCHYYVPEQIQGVEECHWAGQWGVCEKDGCHVGECPSEEQQLCEWNAPVCHEPRCSLTTDGEPKCTYAQYEDGHEIKLGGDPETYYCWKGKCANYCRTSSAGLVCGGSCPNASE